MGELSGSRWDAGPNDSFHFGLSISEYEVDAVISRSAEGSSSFISAINPNAYKDKGMERHTGMMEVNCCAPNAAPVFRFNGILLPAWL
jgi:hypothetical protein